MVNDGLFHACHSGIFVWVTFERTHRLFIHSVLGETPSNTHDTVREFFGLILVLWCFDFNVYAATSRHCTDYKYKIKLRVVGVNEMIKDFKDFYDVPALSFLI